MLVKGLTSKQIGKALSISPRTVEVHRARVFEKTQAKNAIDLALRLYGIDRSPVHPGIRQNLIEALYEIAHVDRTNFKPPLLKQFVVIERLIRSAIDKLDQELGDVTPTSMAIPEG